LDLFLRCLAGFHESSITFFLLRGLWIRLLEHTACDDPLICRIDSWSIVLRFDLDAETLPALVSADVMSPSSFE
jgi:hypothetical protein